MWRIKGDGTRSDFGSKQGLNHVVTVGYGKISFTVQWETIMH